MKDLKESVQRMRIAIWVLTVGLSITMIELILLVKGGL